MKRYFIKYFVLLIALNILYQGLIILNAVLIHYVIEQDSSTVSLLVRAIMPGNIIYVINLIFAVIIFFDLKKSGINSVPVILLTLLAYIPGVILSLFLLNTKHKNYDKYTVQKSC
jgi:hypothetical protein